MPNVYRSWRSIAGFCATWEPDQAGSLKEGKRENPRFLHIHKTARRNALVRQSTILIDRVNNTRSLFRKAEPACSTRSLRKVGDRL